MENLFLRPIHTDFLRGIHSTITNIQWNMLFFGLFILFVFEEAIGKPKIQWKMLFFGLAILIFTRKRNSTGHKQRREEVGPSPEASETRMEGLESKRPNGSQRHTRGSRATPRGPRKLCDDPTPGHRETNDRRVTQSGLARRPPNFICERACSNLHFAHALTAEIRMLQIS